LAAPKFVYGLAALALEREGHNILVFPIFKASAALTFIPFRCLDWEARVATVGSE
jgi:hypothetical protein